MPSGEYFLSFDYELYVEEADLTTNPTVPTSHTGMTKVFNLTNASLSGSSSRTAVLDYDSDPGADKQAVTSTSYQLPAEINLSPSDPAYQVLKDAWMNATQGAGITWYKVTPVKDGSGAVAEHHAGVATVSSFSEAVGVGGVAKVTFNCDGYGAMAWTPQKVSLGILANDLSDGTIQKPGPVTSDPDAIGKKPEKPRPGAKDPDSQAGTTHQKSTDPVAP